MSTATAPLDDFAGFCSAVHRLAGIDLRQYKRGQMERRVRSFAQRRGAATLADYLRLLEHEPAELDDFLDRVTINVSQLWRNPDQWRVLATEVVPLLAAKGRIKAWSAGCSYGAEAYTLAAICLDVAPEARVEVFGSDIDRRMIARAREGRFSTEDARSAPPDALRRWFEPRDTGWVAAGELRSRCRFEVGDLLRTVVPHGSWDLIVCRNVVIYFTELVRNDLHARLAAGLRSGGYLVVGGTERVAEAADLGLTARFPFTYEKR